jgi:hypothetical protein
VFAHHLTDDFPDPGGGGFLRPVPPAQFLLGAGGVAVISLPFTLLGADVGGP